MKFDAVALVLGSALALAGGCALDAVGPDATAGTGGQAGLSGSGGQSGGNAGAAGQGGSAGAGGRAGSGGANAGNGGEGGDAGASGEAGESGLGGSSGAAGEAGAAGTGGDDGAAGASGAGGEADGTPITNAGLRVTWTLERASNGNPLTCEEIGGVTVEVLSTDNSSGSQTGDLFDCDAGTGIAVRDFGVHTFSISVLNADELALGAAPARQLTLGESPCDAVRNGTCLRDFAAAIIVDGF